MKSRIEVKIKVDNEVVAIADYLQMHGDSTYFHRTFHFYGLKILEEVDWLWVDFFEINILEITRESSIPISEFDIIVKDYKSLNESPNDESALFNDLENGELVIIGIIKPTASDIDGNNQCYWYSQGYMDLMNILQKGDNLEWESLPIGSPIKPCYFGHTVQYHGQQVALDKNRYVFDMEKIKEEGDFLYYAGLEFFGELGYMGGDMFSFKTCLEQLVKNAKNLNKKEVRFINCSEIKGKSIQVVYEQAVQIFKQNNFRISVVE